MEQELILSARMPVVAMRGITVFPDMLIHFDVAREKSVRALDAAMEGNRQVLLIQQKDLMVDDPESSDLCAVGTVAVVRQTLKLPGEMTRVLVEGKYRAKISSMEQVAPFMTAQVESLQSVVPARSAVRAEALIRQSYEIFGQFTELLPKGGQEAMIRLLAAKDPGFIADFIAQNANFHFTEKQELLEQLNAVKRLEQANRLLNREIQTMQLQQKLGEKVQESLEQNQKEYFLREQMKAIREELGEDADDEAELDAYEEKIRALPLEQEYQQKLLGEVRRIRRQPAGSSEAAVLRTYVDTVLELPWQERSKERLDLKTTKRMLDEDHYGLDKVKERILETVAVRKLTPNMQAPILCLVGPPGVGKTSIAMSIARCLNRKLARISLGGVHDEADIRGHRKTYVGAMPGRIMAGVRQAGTRNPLLLLDEIDKMGSDYRGDPSSALLEVLDSEQNATFRDHYLEIPFDLSECMFITTANTLDTVPRPLLDRMEIIELESYTDEEKVQIAKRHLLPKQMKKHGLEKTQLKVTDDALRTMIRGWTREAGVRSLERELAKLCRKTAVRLTEDAELKKITVRPADLEAYLGTRKFMPEERCDTPEVGLVNGLAWTAAGGETLQVEVNVMNGTGKLELTGNLGKVMEESAAAAVSFIRANAERLHVDPNFYKEKDIHIHFPEGAVPKDGPSAGITICTAVVSALTGAPVRPQIAMTGEISIRGRVMAIGGLKEKSMAALRHGVKTVYIPKDNEKNLDEIDQLVRAKLTFVPVTHAEEVLEAVLDFSKVPVPQPALQTGEPAKDETAAVPLPAGSQKSQTLLCR